MCVTINIFFKFYYASCEIVLLEFQTKFRKFFSYYGAQQERNIRVMRCNHKEAILVKGITPKTTYRRG